MYQCGPMMHRGTEVVESTVRQHIGACFSALEQRVLSTLSEASQRLSSSSAAAPAPRQDASTQDKPLLQVSRPFLSYLQTQVVNIAKIQTQQTHGAKHVQVDGELTVSWCDAHVIAASHVIGI